MAAPDISNRTGDMLALWPEATTDAGQDPDTASTSLLMEELISEM